MITEAEVANESSVVRRLLLWSGWVFLGEAAICLALFGWFAEARSFVAGPVIWASICFLLLRYWERVKRVAWMWLIPLIPAWLICLTLIYYIVLGTYVQLIAKPVPAQLIRPTPSAADIVALDEAKHFLPPKSPEDAERSVAIKLLGDVRPAAGESWDSVLNSPPIRVAIAESAPYLDTYFEFYAHHRPTHAVFSIETEFPDLDLRGTCGKAELIIIRDLARTTDGAPEARARYDRLLKSSSEQLHGSSGIVGVLIEIRSVGYFLNLLEQPPGYFFSAESAQSQAALLAEMRGLLNPAYKESYQAEWQAIEGVLARPPDLTQLSRLNNLDSISLEDSRPTVLQKFPFFVKRDCEGTLAGRLNLACQVADLPIPAALLAIERFDRELESQKVPWGPNPYGRTVCAVLSPVYTAYWSKTKILESKLAAYECGLRWQVTGSLAPVTDPMTGALFHPQILPDRLIIGGGHPKIGEPRHADEVKLAKYGLTGQCLYVIEMPRPR